MESDEGIGYEYDYQYESPLPFAVRAELFEKFREFVKCENGEIDVDLNKPK
jgi:hypothetical protein